MMNCSTMGNMALFFAGKAEYQQDLKSLREALLPIKGELRDIMKFDRFIQNAVTVEKEQEDLEQRLHPSKEADTLSLFQKIGHRTQKGLLSLKRGLLSLRAFGSLVIMAFRKDALSVKSQPSNEQRVQVFQKQMAQRTEDLSKLEAIVQRLRKEPDPLKVEWLKEFESTNQPLTKLERFALNDWSPS